MMDKKELKEVTYSSEYVKSIKKILNNCEVSDGESE